MLCSPLGKTFTNKTKMDFPVYVLGIPSWASRCNPFYLIQKLEIFVVQLKLY